MSTAGEPRTVPPFSGLASPGAYAVLVGTGRHVEGSALPGLPGVDTTLDDLQQVLADVCGMDPDRIRRLPADAGPTDVVAVLEQTVAEATAVVLFYYVGHGLLGPSDELYLATRESRSADSISHAVSYRTVKDLLSRSIGGSVVVLDCCFSGRAIVPGNGRTPDPYTSARPDGSFLLSSASHFAASFAPQGERHTLFSGRLIDMLRDGVPSGPPTLTLDGLHSALARVLADGPLRPQRWSEGTLGQLVIARNRAYRLAAVPLAGGVADVPCPYPGMEPFHAEDHAYFYGRDELTERLLAAVCDTDALGPVVLVGASGVGKSSLLRAGLLAALEHRHQADSVSTPWPAMLLPGPGPHPLRALADLWARATGRQADQVRQELAHGSFPAPLPGHPACRLLVVDQFEEVFTSSQHAEERELFIRLLCGPDTKGVDAERLRIVLSVRADHYGNCLAHPPLARALGSGQRTADSGQRTADSGQRTIAPMANEALRVAIEAPARGAGLTLEPGLADRLLHDLHQGAQESDADRASGPGAALPFLAHALRETWLARSGTVLTLASYQSTGGIWESVTTATERLYQRLDKTERQALRALLLRMVYLTSGADVVRRRVRTGDLADEHDSVQQRLVARILDRLVRARLITVNHGDAQISHEALLRAWPRLRSWIRDARSELLARQQLAEATTEWEERDRRPEYLYAGAHLAKVRPAAGTVPLTAGEQDFLRESAAAERGQLRRRRMFQTALVVVLVTALLAGFLAWQQHRANQPQRAQAIAAGVAQAAESLRASDPVTAMLLSVAAWRIHPGDNALAALHTAVGQAEQDVFIDPEGTTVEGVGKKPLISRDGGTLVNVVGDRVGVWDLRTHRRTAEFGLPESMMVSDYALSANGRLLGVPTSKGAILFELRTGRRIRTGLSAESGTSVYDVVDGGRLVAVGKPGDTYRIWDTEQRREVFRASAKDLPRTALSADGRYVVICVNGRPPRVRDLERNRDLRLRAAADSSTRAKSWGQVDFSPDGRRLAAASGDHGAMAWDLPSGQARPGFHIPASWLAFSPDGRFLATASGDELMVYRADYGMWELLRYPLTDTPALLSELAFDPTAGVLHYQSREAIRSIDLTAVTQARWRTTENSLVQFSPDASTAVVLEGKGPGSPTVLRDAVSGRRKWGPLAVVPRNSIDGGWAQAAFSRDGKLLAVAGEHDDESWGVHVTVWDVERRKRLADLAPFGGSQTFYGMTFTTNGTRLAMLSAAGVGSRTGGRMEIWDVARRTKVRTVDDFSETGIRLQGSPDGRMMVASDGDVVDLATGKVRRHAFGREAVDDVAFSDDGTRLAVARATGWIELWDAARLRLLGRMPSAAVADGDLAGQQVHPLVFSPDGETLAAVIGENTVQMWNAKTRRMLGTAVAVPAGRVFSLRFTSDGRLRVGGTNTAPSTTVESEPERLVANICQRADRELTEAEWQTYVPELPYHTVC